MAKLTIPVAKVDDVDVGQVVAVILGESTLAIALAGYYKIAAMGTNLLWKLGAVAVTVTSGSYLKDGDQEIIYVPADASTLRFLRSTDAAADGEINVVAVNIQEIPGVEPRAMLP